MHGVVLFPNPENNQLTMGLVDRTKISWKSGRNLFVHWTLADT